MRREQRFRRELSHRLAVERPRWQSYASGSLPRRAVDRWRAERIEAARRLSACRRARKDRHCAKNSPRRLAVDEPASIVLSATLRLLKLRRKTPQYSRIKWRSCRPARAIEYRETSPAGPRFVGFDRRRRSLLSKTKKRTSEAGLRRR